MRHLYDVAGGTVPGTAHARAGRNNQDAFHWSEDERGLAAVVCDGCGSAVRSEIGALLGARIVTESVLRHAPDWDRIRVDVLARLELLASLARLDAEQLLFTIVGAWVTPERAVVFAAGDGVVEIDGERIVLGPYDAPPYLAYGCVPFTIVREQRAQRILLGTDGLSEIAVDVDDFCFRNRDGIRRRLAIARPFDDATLVAIRRIP